MATGRAWLFMPDLGQRSGSCEKDTPGLLLERVPRRLTAICRQVTGDTARLGAICEVGKSDRALDGCDGVLRQILGEKPCRKGEGHRPVWVCEALGTLCHDRRTLDQPERRHRAADQRSEPSDLCLSTKPAKGGEVVAGSHQKSERAAELQGTDPPDAPEEGGLAV